MRTCCNPVNTQLAPTALDIHIRLMSGRRRWHKIMDHSVTEWILFALGLTLLLLSPLVGAIPGPGGIIVAGLGLALILKSSSWAKRRYVRFKRWQPKAGRWTDWALRRRSAERRETLRKVGGATEQN